MAGGDGSLVLVCKVSTQLQSRWGWGWMETDICAGRAGSAYGEMMIPEHLSSPFPQIPLFREVGAAQVTGGWLGSVSDRPPPFFTLHHPSPPPSTTASSSNSSTGMPEPLSRQQGSQLSSIHFLLLVFLKVPLLLGMLSAVLWVHRPQGAICGETQPA